MRTFIAIIILCIGTFSTTAAHAIELQWQNLQGEYETVQSHAGKPLLLHFWASWCPPCRNEMPSLHAWMQRNPSVNMRIISLDTNPENAKDFLQSSGINIPLLLADTAQVAALGVRGLPATLVIDKEGTMVKRKVGDMDWDNAEQTHHISKLLGVN